VVGAAETAAGVWLAVLWKNSTVLDLGTLGGATSEALSINDAGQIVGDSMDATGASRAFLYDGTLMDLNSLIPPGSGWLLQSAQGINNAGRICGFGLLQNPERAYLLIPS
jgi:probable HAF family extracellular repeat protein